MSTESTKSQIKEVLDQVSLDYADGKYLNRISGNLGLNRPKFGFSDDTWRAVTRLLALQFKQISNKFRDVLEVLVGPKTTRVVNPENDIEIGSSDFVVHDTTELPDAGEIVWDEGLSTEETVEYCFVDRGLNTVFLSTTTLFGHNATSDDAESLVLRAEAGGTEVLVSSAADFPQSGFPYTLVLGRGTDKEEVVQLLGVDVDSHTLTTSTITNSHEIPFPNLSHTTVQTDYAIGSYFLLVDDASVFPDAGTLILEDSSNSFTVDSATTTTITLAASTFTRNNSLVPYKIAFDGNITSSLENVEVFVKANTDTVITLFEALGTAPASGDTFTVRPVVEFTGRDISLNSINIQDSIAAEVSISDGTLVEYFVDPSATAALASIQVKGKGWELVENGSGLLEILIPETDEDLLRLLDAAYVHDDELDVAPSTTVRTSTTETSEEATLFVDSSLGFPESGVLSLPLERVGYAAKTVVFLKEKVEAGDTTLVVTDASKLPGVGGVIDIDINGSGETVTVSSNNTLTNTITLTAGLSSTHLQGALIREAAFTIPYGFATASSVSDPVTLYEPVYSGTAIIDGRVDTSDTFRGPYVFDEVLETKTLDANTLLDQTLAGPTRLAITLDPTDGTKTAVELENGNLFPLSGTFQLTVGSETMTATEVSLKQRCQTELDGGHPPGSTTLTCAAGGLRGSLTAGAKFPLAQGYRVVLDKGTAVEEVVFVTGLSGDTLTIDPATTNNHSTTGRVSLYSDTVSVDQIDSIHTGVNSYDDRFVSVTAEGKPSIINADSIVERVTPLYDNITVVDGSAYPTSGDIILGSGSSNQRIETHSDSISAGDGQFTCLGSTGGTDAFPTVYPYFIVVEPGHYREEIVEVSNNDTGTDTFTIIGFGAAKGEFQYSHPSGSIVRLLTGERESFTYDSVSGNVISFSSPIMVESNHQSGEKVALSSEATTPSETGTDYAFIVPPDLLFKLKLLFNLIRAAGVEVKVVSTREEVTLPEESPFAPLGAQNHWDAQFNADNFALSSWIDRISKAEVTQPSVSNRPIWSNTDTAFSDSYSVEFQSSNNQYLDGANVAIQSLFEGPAFTVAAVLTAVDDGDTKIFFSPANSGTTDNYWYFASSPSEAARVAASDGGFSFLDSSTSGHTTAHYVVWRFDGADINVRVDGVDVGTQSMASVLPSGLDIFSIGRRPVSSGAPFNGKLRDLVIFDEEITGSTLTQTEALLASRI